MQASRLLKLQTSLKVFDMAGPGPMKPSPNCKKLSRRSLATEQSQAGHGELNGKLLNFFSQLYDVLSVCICLEMPVESSELSIFRGAVLQLDGNLDSPAVEAKAEMYAKT